MLASPDQWKTVYLRGKGLVEVVSHWVNSDREWQNDIINVHTIGNLVLTGLS